MPDAAAGFSSSAVLPILREACTQAGVSSDGAELLRLGENAIYQLAAAPVVVKIARSADRLRRVERELCVARWLAAADVPAIRALRGDRSADPADRTPGLLLARCDRRGASANSCRPWPACSPDSTDLADCPCELASFDPLKTSESAPGQGARRHSTRPRLPDRTLLRPEQAVPRPGVRPASRADPRGRAHQATC